MLRLAEKAFWPGAHPVPADARRHRPQLPRGHRLPRPAGGRARRAARRRLGAGVDRRGPGARGDRARGQPQPAADRDPARRHRASTASTPCSAAAAATRRRPGPRSGCSPSATSSASGTRRTSGPSCGASTTGATARASTSASSRICNWTELDVWQYIGRGDRAPVDLLRAPARGVPARRHVAGRHRRSSPLLEGEVVETGRCATAPSATPPAPAPSSRRPPTVDDVIAEIAASRITERGATRADDKFSEAAMEDRKKEGYF